MRPAPTFWPALWLVCAVAGAGASPAAAAAPAGSEEARRAEAPHEVGVGLTAGSGDVGVGALMFGIDAWYRPIKSAAFGFEAQGFIVDNGADPQYCSGCLSGGTLMTGFAEGRLGADGVVSGFVRVGVGAADLGFVAEEVGGRSRESADLVLTLALGPQLTLSHFFLRARGLGIFTSETFLGYGLELGGVF